MAKKKKKYHTDDRGHFVWERYFVGGKMKRAKQRVTVIDGKIIDDTDAWLVANANDVDLHEAGRWDLIDQKMTKQETPAMKPPRTIPLRIEELEATFDWLADVSPMGYEEGPVMSFLHLGTGEIHSPEEEENCFGHKDFLRLPGHLFEDLHWGLLDVFVQTLCTHPARGRLVHAIRGKGAFRRFRSIVLKGGDVELKHRWLWFETCEKRRRIVQWLKDENIEPVWDCDLFQAPPLPTKRNDLLLAVAEFIEAASQLPGVLRIALIGSLVTDKAIPKDVDVLVGVADGMRLDELARLSRRMNGKTMATGDGCGADVFLHNSQGIYLGRVCPWKECVPGIRRACQAQHCGERTYLHDDLQNLRLDAQLIQSPPLILWPEVKAFIDLPDDVSNALRTKFNGSRA